MNEETKKQFNKEQNKQRRKETEKPIDIRKIENDIMEGKQLRLFN